MRLPLHNRLLLLTLASGLLPMAVLVHLLMTGDHSPRVILTSLILTVSGWLLFAFAARARATHQLQTLSALLSALREGDFSIRARGARRADPLGEVHAEINLLADTLRENRLEATEATALLRKVMEEMPFAVLALDASGRLALLNPAAATLLGEPEERLLGKPAAAVGLQGILANKDACNFEAKLPGGGGSWCLRRQSFRLDGRPHELVIFADLTAALRQEQVLAWQKLVRVLGHELNNSLAPVKSLAGSLRRLANSPRRSADWEEDLRAGLEIIEGRADSLGRFIAGYAQLARLPRPERGLVELEPLARRLTGLDFTPALLRGPDGEDRRPERVPMILIQSPAISLSADPAQIEQVLINLLKNAVEATAIRHLETGGTVREVRLSWTASGGSVRLRIEDGGPGIDNPENLFVPFFTTKPGGSGIGLVLCRQIIENHGGSLTLSNLEGDGGARAEVQLPL